VSGKIKSAMMYPTFVVIVVVGVVFIMMTLVVPKLLDIFDDKASLPASTKALIAISDAFSNYWYLMIAFVVIAIVFVSIWKKTPS
jgi:type IV pilus assembly protein PilC